VRNLNIGGVDEKKTAIVVTLQRAEIGEISFSDVALIDRGHERLDKSGTNFCVRNQVISSNNYSL